MDWSGDRITWWWYTPGGPGGFRVPSKEVSNLNAAPAAAGHCVPKPDRLTAEGLLDDAGTGGGYKAEVRELEAYNRWLRRKGTE